MALRVRIKKIRHKRIQHRLQTFCVMQNIYENKINTNIWPLKCIYTNFISFFKSSHNSFLYLSILGLKLTIKTDIILRAVKNSFATKYKLVYVNCLTINRVITKTASGFSNGLGVYSFNNVRTAASQQQNYPWNFI